MEYDKFIQLLRELEKRQVDYVLVGALALNVQGLIRATEDIDLFLPRDAENLQRLKEAMQAVWNDPEIEGIRADDLSGQYGVIRYGPPEDRLVVDLISHLGDAFRYEDLKAETIQWEGINVRVATPETLYRMKKDTLRWKDKIDAAQLREKFELREE